MKVVAISGPRQAALVDRPMPKRADDYVLVKILAAPMCTEFHAYAKGEASDVIGHEAAGEVIEAAPNGRHRPGDRVVVMPQDGCGRCPLCLSGEHLRCPTPRNPLEICGSETGRSTFAQFLLQQDWLLFPVPDDISITHASMACCGLGPTFGAVTRMAVNALDTVLVSGLGPVGLGAVINARVRGARVIGLETNPYRRQLALDLGAEAVIDPRDSDALAQIYDLTHGLGADKSIEASSQESAPAFVLSATRIGGSMTSVGWGGPVAMRDVVRRNVTIHGQWHWNHLQDGAAMIQTLRLAAPLLDRLITHHVPMSQVTDAWELQLSGQCGKIVLDPWK